MNSSTLIPSLLEKPRKRLIRQYHRLGSYHRVADARDVNVAHVYNLIVHGIIPANPKIQRKLGLYPRRPVTINQLMQLPIQDQPTPILRLAFEHRKEMTA
jgi:hypothetical protein